MLKKLDYGALAVFAVLLGLAPFVPEPHIIEKLRMLKEGTLTRPIDIFDLFFHSAPAILLLVKLFMEKVLKRGA